MGACRRGYRVYFEMFLSGKSVPRVGEEVESVMECRDGK